MSARTSDEILKSFQISAAQSDPTADTSKGPLYSLVGRPISQILAPTEALVDELEQLYSVNFAKTATDTQAQAFLDNWGESAGEGQPSTTTVYFMKFSQPGVNQKISIPVGTLVSNSDGSLQYLTTEGAVMDGSIATTYFNASRRSYEVALNVQAVANGPQYDLPAGVINAKVTQLDGIDAIENRTASSGGVAAETPQSQVTRTQQKFMGLAVNTSAGNVSRIRSFNTSLISDVQVVTSSNRALFRRFSYTPAADYYILGTLVKSTTETYVSQVGGETLIPLKNVPVYAINSVKVNNVPISNYNLVSDTSPEFGGSAKAADGLLLGAALLANDVVIISLNYEGLIQGVQNSVFSDTTLFNTNELARRFFEVPLNISIQGRALPGYIPSSVEQNVQTQLQALIEPSVWQEQFQPEIIRQQLAATVSGLTNLQINTFQRSSLANSQVETVIMNENERARYNSNYVTVKISTI